MKFDDVLSRLEGVKRTGQSFKACCPAHDDQTPSLSIRLKDGRILVKCFAGCSAEAIVGAMGLTMRDLFDDDASSYERARAKFAASSGSGTRGTGKSKDWGELVTTYVYEDADGKPLHYVERWHATKPDGTYSKQFPQGRYVDGGKVRGLASVKTVLFRLPQLLRTSRDETVYIPEGEKDVLAFALLGLPATWVPGGGSKFRPDHAEVLRGRPVVIVMDPDPTGRRNARQFYERLSGVAKSVQVVRAKTGKDAHDHFAAGHSVEEFQEIDMSELKDEAATSGTAEPQTGTYREHGGRIERFVRNRDGDGWAAVTENFTARVVEQVEFDDGVEVRREYVVEGVCEGRPLRRVRVPARGFEALGWIGEHWGAFPIVKVGQSNANHAATAMKMLGRHGMVDRTVYPHLGWRSIGGVEVYLHAGGGLGADGPVEGVETDLPNQLAGYLLAEQDGVSRADALRASATFLRAATADVAGTLYAALWRSVIGDVNFSVFVVGPTGTQKSSLTAALLSHFGTGLVDKEDLGVQWSSTANAIEGLLFSAKDAILAVDDYVPSRGTMVDRAQMQKTVSRVLRAAGNRAGRSRMNADSSLRSMKPPRGMLLGTGEELPDGGSEIRRTVVISIEPGAVDLPTLSRVQEHGHSGANASAMVAFVRWVAPRRAELRQRLRTATKSARDGTRLSEQMAELQEMVAIWGEFAAERGLGETEVEDARALMMAGLAGVARQQEVHTQDQDPVSRYLELLGEGLASGTLVIVKREHRPPEILGGRTFIGWEDDEFLYLLPLVTFGAIEKLGMSAQRPLQQQARGLHKMMVTQGLVIPQGKKAVSVLSMGGKDARVLKMRKGMMDAEMRSLRSSRSEEGSDAELEPELTTPSATGESAESVARCVAAVVDLEPEPGAVGVVAMPTTRATPSGNDGFVVIE